MIGTTTPNGSTPAPGTTSPSPTVCLDTCHVENWRFDTRAAILDPQADAHAQFAWLYGQITEIRELLWGYISVSNPAGDRMPEMAHALCYFIEARTVTISRMLEAMCEQTQHQRQGAQP